MLRLVMTAVVGAIGLAEGFGFTIASPVAAQDFQVKSAAFVFRAERCAQPTQLEVSGTAEGLVDGRRQSVAVKVMTSSKPGVYAVPPSWPAHGNWVVSLKGTCAGERAGAIVPIGDQGFIRESTKFFSRPATDAEIGEALTALARSTQR
ncbi:MAG TPA: hypothetical protein VNZ26_33890 [Vicinamibacterales bacterium]|jgi:hypothetical protein|nr:hypothetical protein [Vicinamibacterales bacterium]